MGHIVNLAQQAFIHTLMDGRDRLEGPGGDHTGNADELNLSGLDESPIRGALIGPLLVHMRTLVVRVCISSTYYSFHSS